MMFFSQTPVEPQGWWLLCQDHQAPVSGRHLQVRAWLPGISLVTPFLLPFCSAVPKAFFFKGLPFLKAFLEVPILFQRPF